MEFGVPDDPGSAPVAVWPVVPGTHGLFTPTLSVLPVPIDELLAPLPLLPESEVVSAMDVVDEGACEANVAVRLQADVAEGGVWAKAAAETATPKARETEKTSRDMISSKSFASPKRGSFICDVLLSKTTPKRCISRF